MTLLVWASRDDTTGRAVAERLTATRKRWLGLDPKGFWGEASVAPTLRSRDWLKDIAGILVRPPLTPREGSTALAARYAELAGDLWDWLDEVDTATVLNRPTNAMSNECKLYQLKIAREIGFEVPAALLTTDTNSALAFARRHGAVVVKGGSGARTIVRRYPRLATGDLARLGHCPTMFQSYIPGRDVRVHVVGARLFAHRIASDAVDYRFASREGRPRQINATTVSRAVGRKCRALAERLGLLLAGVDLRESADGRWFCFEVNPAPAFGFYESYAPTGLTAAAARLLSRTQHRDRCLDPGARMR